jgi:dihydrofolate reductase
MKLSHCGWWLANERTLGLKEIKRSSTQEAELAMRKLVFTTFLTLDGVMQGPGGPTEDTSEGFTQGGWLVPFVDEEMGSIIVPIFEAADAFLFGRKTFEIFASHWPRVTDPKDPIAAALNKHPKYVASKASPKTDWHNSALLKGELAEAIYELKQQPRANILVQGSSGLTQSLIKHDLIDEYHLWLYPVILGHGKRLFGEGCLPTTFKHLDTKRTSTGVYVNHYERIGRPSYGAIPDAQ